MLSFATYFDINYLGRGLALLASLKNTCRQEFKMYILALDDQVADFFQANTNPAVIILRLSELEKEFPELPEIKGERSVIEYYFTLSPFLPLFILRRFPEVTQVTTMDADLYFFDDPARILDNYPDASVLITPHHFSEPLQYLEKYGKYNVSFQSFKNDPIGLQCLEFWAKCCVEWCFDHYDEIRKRFADQKYLDAWPEKFEGVANIDLQGAGLAPWNIENYKLQVMAGKIFVNEQPLIYYHFHHLRVFNGYFAFNGLEQYQVNTDSMPLRVIYHAYLKCLKSCFRPQGISDSNVKRIRLLRDDHLLNKLRSEQGYWFFNERLILHLNPGRRLNRIKNSLKARWQN